MATAVDELLDMLFDMIDEAKNAAFSGDKCVIERDKALDLIEDAKRPGKFSTPGTSTWPPPSGRRRRSKSGRRLRRTRW